jgi:3-polyprenyl-4-hydroxybenzoate decarboxylase
LSRQKVDDLVRDAQLSAAQHTYPLNKLTSHCSRGQYAAILIIPCPANVLNSVSSSNSSGTRGTPRL